MDLRRIHARLSRPHPHGLAQVPRKLRPGRGDLTRSETVRQALFRYCLPLQIPAWQLRRGFQQQGCQVAWNTQKAATEQTSSRAHYGSDSISFCIHQIFFETFVRPPARQDITTGARTVCLVVTRSNQQGQQRNRRHERELRLSRRPRAFPRMLTAKSGPSDPRMGLR